MRWVEFNLKIVLLVTIVAFTMVYFRLDNLPIAPLAVAMILLAEEMLVNPDYIRRSDKLDKSSFIYRIRQLDERLTTAIIVSQLFIMLAIVPHLYFFVPVFYFEHAIKQRSDNFAFPTIFLLGVWLDYHPLLSLAVMGLSILTSYLHTAIVQSVDFEEEAYSQIDLLQAINNRAHTEHQNLIRLQDRQSESQLLAERKRIVSEIHDILGHHLSSAVIQIGALEYMTDDPQMQESLGQVKGVLNTSMNNIRKVIHEERSSTVDLERELHALADAFTKANISLVYQNKRVLPDQYAHSIINIVREGLANINKHSNASQVQIRFIETLNKWHLLIADNGNLLSHDEDMHTGIGIMGMEERVQLMNGTMHISKGPGFHIFITIPFERE
ncbi:hypothetical protein EF384_07325 [Aerococcus agrisoli]|uniref:histidine kinase n=1 Tax=Aerococcus agrisoli TaxID=2487350 RepID=A0A3N4G6M6_9LACT|nr:histidine kinase [Aerococcus agrisoli]RPA58449.1 hypothetical protein EF384_07325 [Aerococcus agrisoli]